MSTQAVKSTEEPSRDRISAGAGLFLADPAARYAHVPSLDGLRAMSILIVLLSHFVAANFFPGGFGVLVFFVISGFLITRLLFAEIKAAGRIQIGNFFVRRFFRLYPVLLVYTIAVLLLYWFDGSPINWIEPASAIFYFANYLYAHIIAQHPPDGFMPFGIVWSLSLEEHFYLLFPLAFIFLKGRPEAIARLMAATIVICLGSRLALAHARPDLLDTYWFYYTELRIDSIAFGVLLAALCETETGRAWVRRLENPFIVAGALAALLACFLIRDPWFRETLRYSILGAAVSALVAAILFSSRYRISQAILNLAAIRWVGTLSYSLYLWHIFAAAIMVRHTELSGAAHVAVAFILSFTFAAISYYCLERPMMTLRHRFGSRTV